MAEVDKVNGLSRAEWRAHFEEAGFHAEEVRFAVALTFGDRTGDVVILEVGEAVPDDPNEPSEEPGEGEGEDQADN